MNMRERQVATYAARVAEGLCIRCGKVHVTGRRVCLPCTAKVKVCTDRRLDRINGIERRVPPPERTPISARDLRTCPTCGMRDIATIGNYGEDRLPMCSVCARDDEPAGYPVNLSLPDRVTMVARTCPGLTAIEIAEHLGDPDRRQAIQQALYAAIDEGILRVEGKNASRTYHPAKPWRLVANKRKAA